MFCEWPALAKPYRSNIDPCLTNKYAQILEQTLMSPQNLGLSQIYGSASNELISEHPNQTVFACEYTRDTICAYN